MSVEEPLDPQTVQGVRHLKKVFGLLERLAPVGCERDRAGNRELLFSQYASLVLLGLFNPTLQSVAGLQELSALRKVQKLLGGSRVSAGSFSESVRVFDPEALRLVFEELLESLPPPARTTSTGSIPEELLRRLTIADGTVLKVLPRLVSAAAVSSKDHWRMHLEFQVCRGLPEQMTLTPNQAGGEADERSVLERQLRPGRTYLLDGGYERYSLLEAIVQEKSDYLCRVQKRPMQVLQERALTPEDREAGVVRDELVRPKQSRPGGGTITHPVRRITLMASGPSRLRTDRAAPEELVLLTNLVDVPAQVLSAVYRMRWSIELFFRFLKHVLGCRHLISEKPQGIAIQMYCALIAALLLSQLLGQSVGQQGLRLVSLYLSGWAEEDELLAALARLRSKKTSR
jgi:IS4 transposase